ncbi:MAG: DEAD/DEAH box helicase, partial [Elusimicrobiota bacterium]
MKITGLPSAGSKAFYIFEKFLSQNLPFSFITKTDEDVEIAFENFTSASLFYKYTLKDGTLLKFTENSFEKIETLISLKRYNKNFILIASEPAIAASIFSPLNLKTLKLTAGTSEHKRQHLIEFLSTQGYERVDFVEDTGEFSVRGEIIDFWSSGCKTPLRVVYSEDTIETIRTFGVENQRTIDYRTSAEIFPATITDTSSYLNRYLPQNTVFLIDEEIENKNLPGWMGSFNTNFISSLEGEDAGYSKADIFSGNVELFKKMIVDFRSRSFTITIFCSNTGEQERIAEIDGKLNVYISRLNEGFVNDSKKIAIFSFNDIFSKLARPPRIPKFKSGKILEGLWEITTGDFVVHERYGIGKYRGLRQMPIFGRTQEFLFIEYRGGDKLYVPISDFKKVQKYIGIEGRPPRLFSMDSPSWERVKLRARESASELAKQLFELYKVRKSTAGYIFKGELLFEKILADSFIYTETPDQMQAINEVLKDMESTSPMERLVLGDVGFGKTEVAVRASFKAALSSKQTAVLCPTTILAQQHYEVFTKRLESFPVNVALLTRFQTPLEQKKILTELKKGVMDIIIGTHRLLQKDVSYKELGLLIIDEEHRFGVRQKELIKMAKKNLDVLSLTATPIPRTLSMSLAGIKDLSLIETPPEGRLSIETYISAYNDDTIKKAIESEVERGGQVYYVHNRIFSIKSCLNYLSNLMPSVKFAAVHGRLSSREIEKVMYDFTRGKIDCLITTSIIESGIDLPNVNTMLIERAEEFGLAQLYQLRGRIGRGRLKAYCYLFFSEGLMTKEAKKRLSALREFTHLGS